MVTKAEHLDEPPAEEDLDQNLMGQQFVASDDDDGAVNEKSEDDY